MAYKSGYPSGQNVKHKNANANKRKNSKGKLHGKEVKPVLLPANLLRKQAKTLKKLEKRAKGLKIAEDKTGMGGHAKLAALEMMVDSTK